MHPENAKPTKQVRHFHVVGGGCFGTQYTRWLLRARSLGMLGFEKIYAVDRDSHCRLSREFSGEPGIISVTMDWQAYLTRLLLEAVEASSDFEDHWVPSPLSPHLIFGAFQGAAAALLQGTNFIPDKFDEKLPPPVRIALASGDQALSFAEWVCPVNCIEPPRCPAIHAPRDWDMKSCLENNVEKSPGRSIHVLQCRHFVHGVGTIPMREIFAEFKRFQLALRGGNCRELVVATTSGCHGLISRATVAAGMPRSRSETSLPPIPPY